MSLVTATKAASITEKTLILVETPGGAMGGGVGFHRKAVRR